MPKSKRERKSALTQVQKKTRAVKDALVSKIREAVEEASSVYVFQVSHMKNTAMKSVREAWPGSKFFLGKNKVMQLALGKTPQEELKPGLAKLAQHITGTRGLLVTDRSEEEVQEALQNVSEMHYARSGFVCTANYKLAAGTLPADRCPHPIEPQLRKLGLPTRLVQGRVELLNDVNVCRIGDVLTPEQCKILQLFGVKLAKFNLQVLYLWQNGKVKELSASEDETPLEPAEEDEEGIELRTAGGDNFDFSFEDEMGDGAAASGAAGDDEEEDEMDE